MTELSIVIVVGLLGLCWLLHTITWPLVRLVRAELWQRTFEFFEALCGGFIGGLIGYGIGVETSGTVAAVINAPLAAYSMFLVTTCATYAREFVNLPSMIQRPRWVDAWTNAKITTKSYLRHTPFAVVAFLTVPSIVVLAIGISWGSPLRGTFLAALLWFLISQFGGLVHEVRWFGANWVRLAETGTYPDWLNPPPPGDDSVRTKVRRAVWGF